MPARLKPLEAILERMVLGQMVQPPNTAIATPLQQAVSNLQSGGMGAMPGGFANLPNQGMQSRAQLGLPDRSSYFPGNLNFDEAAALGAFPNVPGNPQTIKAGKGSENLIPTKKARKQAGSPELTRSGGSS